MTEPMKELANFDQLKADITVFVAPTFDIKVNDKETSVSALETAKMVKSYLKKVEDKRKDLVGPLNDRVKEINAYAKKITEPLEKSEAHLKLELTKFERELERIRQEEFKKAEQERLRVEAENRAKIEAAEKEAKLAARFGTEEEAAAIKAKAFVEKERIEHEAAIQHKMAVSNVESMKVSGARKTWAFKVINKDLLPDEYFIIDEKKIREDIRLGARAIPGLEIYQETSVAIR